MKKAPDFDTFAILVKVDKKSEFKKTKMNLQAGLTVMSGSLLSLAFESYNARALQEKKANVTSGMILFFWTLYRTISNKQKLE